MRFYYPLKPTRITIDSFLFEKCESDPNYILQIKKNGWRVQIHKDGDKVEFYTRHNKRLESIVQDADWNLLTETVLNLNVESIIIDGEFLHRRGVLKNTIYVWDAFELNRQKIRKPYEQRKEILEQVVPRSDNILVVKDYHNNFLDVWNRLIEEEDEGIVIKDLRELPYISHSKTIKSGKQFKILLDDKRNVA